MATVTKTIAESIITNNGYYLDDPRIVAVIKYTNIFDRTDSFAVCYTVGQASSYVESEAVINPMIIFATNEAADRIKEDIKKYDEEAIAEIVISWLFSRTCIYVD